MNCIFLVKYFQNKKKFDSLATVTSVKEYLWYRNKPINYKDLNIINYWLEQWCLFYENIFNKYHSNKNCIFLIYEKLIDEDYIKLLLKKINLYDFDNLKLDYFKISNKHEVNNNLNNYNYERAKKIYRKYLNAD